MPWHTQLIFFTLIYLMLKLAFLIVLARALST